MTDKRHIVVLDPTAFAGGSKVATNTILSLVNPDTHRITILSADPHSWRDPRWQRQLLVEPAWLSHQEQGLGYFIRHGLIAIHLLLLRWRHGVIDVALGASGPGVDLALYLLKPLLGYRLLQLIHGPVACSRTIGRCLNSADEIHHLDSAKASLNKALSRVSGKGATPLPERYQVMQNGLSAHDWPSPCQLNRPVVFWAASLLKWKGLDILIDALRLIAPGQRPDTHICYIRPRQTRLPVSQAPIRVKFVHWHHQPDDFDRLRASANIFVSTSENEPFGLSILEAMAAGHCLVLPADGAYWDRHLRNGLHCIKYQPGNAADLASKLQSLGRNLEQIKTLGAQAAELALNYRAQHCYRTLKESLEGRAVQPTFSADNSLSS